MSNSFGTVGLMAPILVEAFEGDNNEDKAPKKPSFWTNVVAAVKKYFAKPKLETVIEDFVFPSYKESPINDEERVRLHPGA